MVRLILCSCHSCHSQCIFSYCNRIHAVSTNTVTSTAPKEAAQETKANTQAIGFSVAIGVLSVTGVLLLVMLIVVALTRKQNNREVIMKGKFINTSLLYLQFIRLLQRSFMLYYTNNIDYHAHK